jgi:hypothetical protein
MHQQAAIWALYWHARVAPNEILLDDYEVEFLQFVVASGGSTGRRDWLLSKLVDRVYARFEGETLQGA